MADKALDKPYFEKVAVIGVGLIGGSLAISLREKGLCGEIVGIGRGKPNLEEAVRLGVIDDFSQDAASGVEGADFVFLSVPVGSMGSVVRAASSGLKHGAILTDGGSVKAGVIEDVLAALPEGARFVPGHPIAGTEFSGVGAAFSGLYEGKKCILTPTTDTDAEALALVRAMWEAIGATVVEMDPKRHDIVLGAVSHLPHVIAYALVNTIAGMEGEENDILGFSAGGFKDFTRIASSSPRMWSDICSMNREAVLGCIEDFERCLGAIKDSISKGDFERLDKSFEDAKRVRDTLNE